MPEICLSTKAWRAGAGWFSQELAAAIARAGATIAFVAPLAEPEAREPSHPNLSRIVTSRELLGSHNRLARWLASARRVAGGLAAVLRLRRSTRTFLFSIPEPLPFSLPLFALLRLSGAQVVLIVHDALPHAWRLPGWARWLERRGLALSYRLADRLVCLSGTNAEVLVKRFGVPHLKIAVIPHGAFRLPRSVRKPLAGNLLAFGSIRPNKHVLETIEAVAGLRRRGVPLRLTIAGEVEDPGYWRRCCAAARKAPEAFVLRPGFVPDDAMPQLLEEAEAVMLPYGTFASQSGVAVLAGLCGRPVIATRSGGLAELLDAGLAGEVITEAATPAAIAAAIMRFRAHPPEEWLSLAEAGKTRLGAALDWDAIGARYVALLREGDVGADIAAERT